MDAFRAKNLILYPCVVVTMPSSTPATTISGLKSLLSHKKLEGTHQLYLFVEDKMELFQTDLKVNPAVQIGPNSVKQTVTNMFKTVRFDIYENAEAKPALDISSVKF